ncbi:MAG: toll/interleukin-1 receptor domain-containing protein [Acidobacteria bacterium]|nr:toll/interleukin-1 receptor domain-containing protein [Acidobacteriota bacterium]
MAQDVFIPYSRVDLPLVERLNVFLADVGISTWFDRKSLLPGQKWENVIDDEIPRSRTYCKLSANWIDLALDVFSRPTRLWPENNTTLRAVDMAYTLYGDDRS